MARLNSALVDARETFVYNAFKNVPSPSIKEVNAQLKASVDLGQMEMAPNRIYPIRDAAVAGNPIPPKVSTKKIKNIANENEIFDAEVVPNLTEVAVLIPTVIDTEVINTAVDTVSLQTENTIQA